jgi:hypothetical protein
MQHVKAKRDGNGFESHQAGTDKVPKEPAKRYQLLYHNLIRTATLQALSS